MTLFRPKLNIQMLTGVVLALVPSGVAIAAPGPAIEIELYTTPVESEQQITEPETPQALDPHIKVSAVLAEGAASGVTLNIVKALQRALANHPGLASLDKEYWALDNIAWQEGRKPNPELELEFEEFGGTGNAKGVRAMATTLTYIQPIERGGKRAKREVAASLEREVALWDIAELEHEIQAGVRTAYAAAQAAQYEVEQLHDYRRLMQRIYDTVAASVKAGRSARLELERFDIELTRLDLELAVAERGLKQAYLELAGTWGATVVDFDTVELVKSATDGVPHLHDLLPLLDSHPALARYDAEYQALCALVDLENANGVPDMALSGCVTRVNEAEETVFSVGAVWDLSVHDKNEGNISAAGYRLEQVADNKAATWLELESELAALRQLSLNALMNYQAYRESLMPAASKALALTEEGYRYGKFELLDVLDAQRTVLELEAEETTALMEFHRQLAEIEALLNINLAEQVGSCDLSQPTTMIEPVAAETLTIKEHHHD